MGIAPGRPDPYNRRTMGGQPPYGPVGADGSGPLPPSWVTGLAFGIVIVPFAVAVIQLLAGPGSHIYLSDDLALIDLHTRRALQWKQQLGVFDHNGWNHPGPAYFYLLSLVYRVLGHGARAMFVGATLLNALSAVACVEVVRRRTTPARALWCGLWVCGLGSVLAMVGPGSVTYSESSLGGLVSPWNPMVVIFPLLLFILLGAAATARSTLSLVGAVLVGSFVVQTNISTLPLVVAVGAVATVVWVATTAADRRRASSSARGRAGNRRVRLWAGLGAVVFVLMWLPPVVQQLTNHPGNFTLIERFFTAGYPGHSLRAGVGAVVAVFGILVEGPAEVMHSNLALAPHHGVAATLATAVVLAAGVAATVVAVRQRLRFAAGLGALGLVGTAVMVVAVTRLVGHPYGYLVVWAVAVPVAQLIGMGMVRFPLTGPSSSPAHATAKPPLASGLAFRVVAGAVALGVAALFVVRVTAIPSLDKASDGQVAELVSLVVPALGHQGSVFVNDSGAGRAADNSQLLDVERFIGLVNQLDVLGYHPTVNRVWRAQFGPGFQATGTEDHSVELETWRPSSPASPGYLGRVGDMAVTLSAAVHGRSTDPADSPG